jgi:hypothetical protein
VSPGSSLLRSNSAAETMAPVVWNENRPANFTRQNHALGIDSHENLRAIAAEVALSLLTVNLHCARDAGSGVLENITTAYEDLQCRESWK